MPRTDDLLDRARRAAGAGKYAQAERYLDQVRNAATERDAHARVEITRAYIEAETGDPAGGAARCRALLDRGGLGVLTEGRAWQQLGLILMRTGETAAAMTVLARAISVLPDRSSDLGYAFINRGNVHLQHGRPREAAADFEAAAARLDDPGHRLERAKAEHNLGYARLLAGDLVGALQMIDEAAQVLAPQSAINRATIEQDRAEVLTAAGRPREAVRSLEQAATAYGSRRLRTYQAECELTLAWTLLREDPARARVMARRAARHFRGQASPARELRADSAAVVAEISAGGRAPALLRRVDSLAADLRAQGLTREAAILQLQGARVTVARGELDDAGARLRSTSIDQTSPVTTKLLHREVRAELATARGQPVRARQHVAAGLADLHEWQSSFGSLDLQSTLVGHGRDLAQLGLGLAVDSGDPATVFEWSERARALAGRVLPVRPPPDEQLVEDLTQLRLLGASDEPRVEELRRRVRERQWHAPGAGAVAEPATLDEVGAALAQDDAVLVAYLVVGDQVTALVAGSGDPVLVDGGALRPLRERLDALSSDLTMAAAHRDDALAVPLRAALRERLAAVSEQLVTPLEHLLGGKRVVLTPSGALAGTPWGLLPGLVGRPLTIPPSATRWLALRAAPAPRSAALVAGPGVARGEEEVTRAAAAWPQSEVLCGADATTAQVAEAAGRVEVLHLAGHGRHTRENPLFSAVELYDGPWFGYDIDQLAQVPSTVVLSACELGRISVRSGEEAIGMSAAWLHAGARTVLSSPVLVADDVACDAMAQWHARVARGAAPADALAEVVAEADDVVPMLSFGGGW
jgi:tetratricopeptide (TPR) repeat protein